MNSSKKSSLKQQYNHLCRAELTTEYLHTNSTTHEFLFGALAELVDNSRDAKAKNLHIYTEIPKVDLRGGFLICFLDDGEGMDPVEAKEVIEFGHSNKKNVDLDLIGQYGNGLKSGSMRLGNDLMIFTKKNGILTILLLSRDFLNAEDIHRIMICLPSFSDETKEPVYEKTEDGRDNYERHKIEMELILKYSPYRTKQELMSQFDKINGKSGTLCIIYSLKLNEDGLPELDIETDPTDILMSHYDQQHDKLSKLEQKSFRAYVSILYYNPRMKIYIQNKKVKTKILEKTLHKPLRYVFKSKKFKSRSNAEKAEAEKKLKLAEAARKEAISKHEHFLKNYNPKSNQETMEYARLVRCKEDAFSKVEEEKLNLERKTRAVNDSKGLEFIFGINVHNRDADGLYIFNSNRLILMSEPTRMQKKPNSEFRGVVGIVNVPYLVLEPTHNKQSFADRSEQQQLITVMSEHMEQYVTECGVDINKDFWKRFGYLDSSRDLPLMENPYHRIRCAQTKLLAQCNDCLKWRELIFHERYLEPGIVPDDWVCALNSEPGRNSCRNVEMLKEIELREYDQNRKQIQLQKEKDKEKERLLKRQQLQQNNYNDFHYDDDDDDQPTHKQKISQKPPINTATIAKNFYSSLNQKPNEKPVHQSALPPTLRSSLRNDLENQSFTRENSYTKRLRFVEDTDSSSTSDDNETRKKQKSYDNDDRKTDPTFRPGQSVTSKNTSKKSTASKTRQPMVVNEDAELNSDNQDDDNQDLTDNGDYTAILENFNNKKKLANKSVSASTTENKNSLIVKPEPADLTSQQNINADNELIRFSLDSRTVQAVTNDERSLALCPKEVAQKNDTALQAIIVNHYEILKEIASKTHDDEMQERIDSFKDSSDVVNFPVSIFVSRFKERSKRIEKQKVEKARQIERANFNSSLDQLKQKLIIKMNMSESTASNLVDEFRP